MLNSLEALAGKISPGSGKNSPHAAIQQLIDTNGSSTTGKATCRSCNHNNNHPYQKPQQMQQQQQQQHQNNQQQQQQQNHHTTSSSCENSPKEK